MHKQADENITTKNAKKKRVARFHQMRPRADHTYRLGGPNRQNATTNLKNR